ncbi:TauD/TfdA family dioxygenase [Phenylobacterium sp. LjRoot225]|uniref:TauD/TfdA dioxygenase family protein n=1 Tax=Phenylobacterium sp. LjRoot225 TaxID=3342285 RepID=UPI003ECCE78F
MDAQIKKLPAVNLTPLTGSEVKATPDDLTSGAHGAELRALLEARGVLIFRNIDLSDEQQLAFSETLGTVVRHGDRSPIQKITLDPNVDMAAEYLKGSLFWHIDGATEGTPNLAATLGARRLPPSGEGDTEFANTYAAWDALPEDEKKAIEKLRVVHSFEAAQSVVYPQPSYEQVLAYQQHGRRSQPLVWTHRSGRKSLVLGCTASHIEGMAPEESSLLLAKLLSWSTQPQFVYRHKWQPGDLLIWDNTGTMHRVQPYDPAERLMHRTTLAGEEAIA